MPGLSLRGGLLFASDDNPLPFKRDLNNFQPRIGMTYQLNDKTVMRGGYALGVSADVRSRASTTGST